MRFDWWTLLLQIVNFLILVWLLRRFLYKPVQAVIAKRRELAEAALTDAVAKRSEVESEKARLDQARSELEASRRSILDAARQEADSRRKAVVAEAEKRAEALIAEARAKAAQAREADIASLKQELAQAAAAIAGRILSQTADESLDAVFRDRILQKLDELARERGGPAGADSGSARIVTASPLAEAEKSVWTEELRTRLGDGVTPEFSVDPDFIAGAELRLQRGRIRFAWADELEEAERLLAASEAAG